MNLYNYKVKVVRVIDGDTVDVMIDLGFNVWIENRIRLFGIDAPETRTKDLEEKEKGNASKVRLEELLSGESDSSGRLTLTSHGVDKYGRCLGTFYANEEGKCTDCLLQEYEVTDQTIKLNLNKLLISEGFATKYKK
jgi:endonuclease YncB( thermonuclease family)